MRSYIEQKLVNTGATKTITQRAGLLTKLAKELKEDNKLEIERSIDWANDIKNIEKILINMPVGTRLTYIYALIALAKANPDDIKSNTLQQYQEWKAKFEPERVSQRKNNIKTPKQEISMSESLSDLQDKLVNILHQGTSDLSINQYQDLLVVSLYLLMPALRNDFGELRLSNRIKNNPEFNWIYVKGKVIKIFLNHFKTATIMGPQIIPIESNYLIDLIIGWIKRLKAYAKENNQEYPEWLLYYSFRGNTIRHLRTVSLQTEIPNMSTRVLGKALTINDYRRLWESWYQNSELYKKSTITEREAFHRKLLHGSNVAQQYNRI